MVFVYSVSPIYPDKVSKRFRTRQPGNLSENADATGVAAALECGTNIKFYLSIDEPMGAIREIAFRSNGCGYMLAAADVIAGHLSSKNLTDLHGLKPNELDREITNALGELPSDREHCVATPIDAIRNAFAEYRRARIEEFVGERALICTCFGVSEGKIESVIQHRSAHTVEDVGRLTNAGTGCGSCQLLIRELIDSAAQSSD